MSLDFRYRRLGYVALNCSDISRSLGFYEEFVGLSPAGQASDGEHLFRCTSRHHDVVLRQGTPGLRRIGWQMESTEDLERLRAHLQGLGMATTDVDAEHRAALGIGNAFRVTEPVTGATFEYYDSMRDADAAFEPTVAKIARLGHVVIATDRHAEAEKFYTESLNYRVSDRIDEAVTFMRCFPNPLHHSFALSKGSSTHLHHVNFMVTDIDDIGKAIYRMKNNEVPVVFGPGRHPPSESIFFYFLDPDGLTLEYSFGMEEFPELGARDPRLMPRKLESIDYWGSVPSADFASKGEIEPLAA